MSEHTPGPWITQRDNYIAKILVPTGRNGCRVVYAEYGDVAYIGPFDDDNGNSNARLIAAAPDLLAVARKAMAAIDENTTFQSTGALIEEFRAAVAKAEGSTDAPAPN